jgi:hypothetical protein
VVSRSAVAADLLKNDRPRIAALSWDTEMSAIWSLSGGKQTFNSTTATAESNNPLLD